MQFYFIRHAQSMNNLLYDTGASRFERSHDPELSQPGREQAQVLARFLCRTGSPRLSNGRDDYNAAGFGITRLYTSLMVRAVATGTVVAQALNLPLVGWQDLHESGGLYLEDERTEERVGQCGPNRAFFERHYPRLVLPDSCDDVGWWNRPFEEHDQAMARARRFLTELLERHGRSDDRVAVISHGDFYNCVLRTLFQIEKAVGWFDLNNAGITRMDFEKEKFRLVYANRVEFLSPELVT
ncbi:MAG: histidine phosphatase family protein [Chloroflexi bacterium]|nr:histidine phosphatase family protein [Chloroflexota bacterium]